MKHRNYIPLSIFVAFIFWISDSLIHWFVYGEETFELIPSDLNEYWMRTLICILIICIGVIATYYTRKLVEKEGEKLRVYKATADESQRILKDFLHDVHYFEGEAEVIGGFDQKSLAYLEGSLRKTEARLDKLVNVGDITAENVIVDDNQESNDKNYKQRRIIKRLSPQIIIFASVSISIFFGAIVFLIATNALNSINEQVIVGNQHHSNELLKANKIGNQMIEATQKSLAYMISGVPEDKEKFMHWIENLSVDNEYYRKIADLDNPNNNQKRELFNEIESQQKELIDNGLDIFKGYEQNGEVNVNTFQDYKLISDRLINLHNQLLLIESVEIDEHNRDGLALIGDTYIKVIFVGLLIFLCLIAIIIYFSFYISHQKIMEEEIHHLHNYVSQLKSVRKI